MRTVFAGLALAALAAAQSRLGDSVAIFNGKNLDGFTVYTKRHGVGADPEGIFKVADGLLHVSGADYGYVKTVKDYDNFYLLVEYKWGQKTWEPRVDKARDSGILFHVSGEDKIWPRSIEYQIIEGGTGDIILVGGAALTVNGERRDKGRFDRFRKGPWKDQIDYRDPQREVERERGEWNVLEMISRNGAVRYWVNGVLVNEGSEASDTRGKLLFQSEGAELFFKTIELRPFVK